MTLKEHNLLLHLSACFQAWGCLEVLVIGMFGSLFEISNFVAFQTDNYCAQINQVLKGALKGTEIEPVCFAVKTRFLAGSWILLVCAIIYVLFGQLMQSLAERSFRTHRKDHGRRRKISIIVNKADDDAMEEYGCYDCFWPCVRRLGCTGLAEEVDAADAESD